MSDDARKLLQDIEEYLNFSSQDSYYAEWLREVKLRITALLSAPAPEPVWIQSNHLQNAMKAPFLCRVEPTKRDGFIPLYTHPPASPWVSCAERLPDEGENIWIGGHGKNGPFYADAKYENGAWLMFDQETDQHCWPCVNPDYWMPIQPLPPLPEDK